MDTGIPLFFSEIEYLLLETIPLETIMRVEKKPREWEWMLPEEATSRARRERVRRLTSKPH